MCELAGMMVLKEYTYLLQKEMAQRTPNTAGPSINGGDGQDQIFVEASSQAAPGDVTKEGGRGRRGGSADDGIRSDNMFAPILATVRRPDAHAAPQVPLSRLGSFFLRRTFFFFFFFFLCAFSNFFYFM